MLQPKLNKYHQVALSWSTRLRLVWQPFCMLQFFIICIRKLKLDYLGKKMKQFGTNHANHYYLQIKIKIFWSKQFIIREMNNCNWNDIFIFLILFGNLACSLRYSRYQFSKFLTNLYPTGIQQHFLIFRNHIIIICHYYNYVMYTAN